MKRMIMAYGYRDQEALLVQVLEQKGIPVKLLRDWDLDHTIGNLASTLEPSAPAEAPGVDQPLMIFSGLDREEFDGILKAVREAGVTVRSLKAMVTPTNRKWTLRSLCAEIQEEHQVMQALLKLKRRRDAIVPPLLPKPALAIALAQADRLLSGKYEVSLEDVQNVEQMLDAAE